MRGRRRDCLVVTIARNHQPGGDRAALPRVRGDGEGRDGRRTGQVGVVEDNERGLAAEFEEDLLDGLRRRSHHGTPGRGGSGERHQVDARVLGQLSAETMVARGDDVDHTGRKVGLLRDDSAHLGRAPRCVGRRLQHDGVAGGQCGPEFGEIDLMRKVPWRDGADDAERLPHQCAPGLDAQRRRDTEIGCPLVRFGRVGGEREIVDRPLKLGAVREGYRRTDLGDGDLPQRLDFLVERVAQLAQAVHAQCGVARPIGLVEGGSRRSDRAIHVGRVGVGGVAERFLGGRVDRGERATARIDELAVDQQLRHLRRRRGGHRSISLDKCLFRYFGQ